MATKTVTANGNAQISTAQSKFGGASGLFDGTGDYLSIPDSTDWDFGSGDFTIDFWFRTTTTATNQMVYQQYVDTNNRVQCFYLAGAQQKIAFGVLISASYELDFTFPFAPSTNTWYHIAITRSSGTMYGFVDGVSQTLTLNSGSYSANFTTLAGSLYIGVDQSGTSEMNGYLDEYRISKGVARWTSGFTPENSPYTYDANTVLLLHMDGTNTSTTFTDSSASNPTEILIISTVDVPSASASYIVPSRTSTLLLGIIGAIGSDTITGATIASNAMTLVGKVLNTGTNGRYTYLFRYYNPPTGSQTIAISGTGLAGAEIGYYMNSALVQTTGTDSAGDSTTTKATSVTTTSDKSYVVAYVSASNGNALSAGSSTAFRSTGTGDGFFDSNEIVTPAGSRTLNIVVAGSGAGLGIIKCELTKSGYTMPADLGTFTLTGNDTTFKRGIKMLAGAGSFVLTGIDVAFVKGYGMIASAGTFVLDGIDAGLTAQRKMIASAGSFTLTGINILFSRGYKLTAELGVFILTGFNVRFPIFWRTITKTPISPSNILKNVSNWINSNKTNI